MRNPLKSRVVAVVGAAGLLVGLGGVGGAVAGQLVTSQDIKDHTIHSWDVHHHGLFGLQVLDPGTVGFRDFNNYTKGLILNGKQGPQGAPGKNGVSGYEVVAHEVTVAAGKSDTVTASCPEGKVALGGGYTLGGHAPSNISVLSSNLDNLGQASDGTWQATAFSVKATNTADATAGITAGATVKATVACAAVN